MMTRGSKVAAEKGRDIEGVREMGSPDRREPITSPDMQESPLFKYLCNLSPIKPAKSMHHAQTYNELTFPPEPRIFASPRSSRRSSTSSLKRTLNADRSSVQAQTETRGSLGHTWLQKDVRNYSSKSEITSTELGGAPPPHLKSSEHASQAAPSSRTQAEEQTSVQPAHVKIESPDNKCHLNENATSQGMFAMNSTQLNPDASSCEVTRTAASAASFQSQFSNIQRVAHAPLEPGSGKAEQNQCDGPRVEQAEGNDIVQSSSSLMQMDDSILQGNLSQESKCQNREHQRSLSMASSSQNEDCLNFNIKCEGEAELDQDTTAMAYFLAGDQDLGQEGEEDWSEDSGEVVISRLPLQQTAGYPDNQSELANDDIEKQDAAMLKAMAIESKIESNSEERHDLTAMLSGDNGKESTALLAQRADTTGQRGFRRRCLDFDASVARRKSLGSMGGRKSLGSRFKDSGGSSSPADDSNPSSVLTDRVDRVAATSDATTSGMPAPIHDLSNANESFRSESNSGGAPARGSGPTCEGTIGAMTKMQLTSCSFKKSFDALNARAAETLTRKPQEPGSTFGGAHMFTPSDSRGCSPSIRPSGIGLHLNSLTSSMSFKRDIQATSLGSSKGVLATVLGIQPTASANSKEDPSGDGYGKVDLGNGGFSAMLNQNFNPGVASLLERRNSVEMYAADASMSSKRVKLPTPDFRPLNIENLGSLEEAIPVIGGNSLPKHESPNSQKRSQPHQQDLLRQPEGETADDLLESPQSSKKRRRKSTPASGEKSGEGCKRCNCKKSKCLKLYCECFAAGVYCVGSCACRECFNKPEYEETVLTTRQQIESRNPLAFAPKIVQAAESSPTPGDEALDTPASARHKRGCNCKKSLCLKKYCECFQAGVGCSEGCRCEGCKNMYGKKEGPEEGEEKEGEQVNSVREESQIDDPIELLNRMSGKSDRLRDSSKQNLSPMTPSFDYDGIGRSMLRLRSTGRKRASSDEHCASPLPQSGARPSKSPTRFSHTIDAFQLVAYSQGDTEFSISGGGESPMTTPTFARIGHLSPRWEGLGDICTLTPLPLAPLRPAPGSSMGTLERPGASPSFSRQLTDPAYQGATSGSGNHHISTRVWSPHRGSPPRFRQPAPRSPLHFDTPRQSQQSSSDQNRPPTPSLQSSPLSGKNLQSELESAKASADDDDTPDFLKYSENNSSPNRTTVTKSGSPKQKRVTPPRCGDTREQQSSRIGCLNPLSSSPGLRNSRKFILQALPSLPPVTPPFNSS